MGIELDNVSETMLVTLYARAKDAKSKNPEKTLWIFLHVFQAFDSF